MANPPITIGPFTNVPAPGSPIKSDWPQSITSSYVEDLRKGRVAAQLSPGSDQAGIGTALTDIAGSAITFTAVAARWYRLEAQYVMTASVAGFVNLYIATGAGAPLWRAIGNIGAGGYLTFSVFTLVSPPAGAYSFKTQVQFPGGGGTVMGGGHVLVTDIGA